MAKAGRIAVGYREFLSGILFVFVQDSTTCSRVVLKCPTFYVMYVGESNQVWRKQQNTKCYQIEVTSYLMLFAFLSSFSNSYK